MSAEHKVTCRECGKKFVNVTNTHLKKHGMTLDEYREKYPGEKLCLTNWLDDWRMSEQNKQNMIAANSKVYSNEDIRNKQKNSINEYWERASSRSKHSLTMKKVVNENPEKFPQCFNSVVTDRMKMSNYERWVEDFGVDIANEKLKEWKARCVIPSKNRQTKIETLCEKFLMELNIDYIPQYDKIGKYWCDFYLPKYNLVLEVDGDYWHANPEMYSEDDVIGAKKTKAKDIWEHDNKKTQSILDAGYNILRIYGNKLKKISTEELYEDIVQASAKVDE